METQWVEPKGDELNEAATAPVELEATAGSPTLESGTWKEPWLDSEPPSSEGMRFDRLTQFLANSLSRRRLTEIATVILAGVGLEAGVLEAGVDARKRK